MHPYGEKTGHPRFLLVPLVLRAASMKLDHLDLGRRQRPSPLCPGELYSASLSNSTSSPGGSLLLPPEQLWATTVSPVFEAPFLAGRLLSMRFPSF